MIVDIDVRVFVVVRHGIKVQAMSDTIAGMDVSIVRT